MRFLINYYQLNPQKTEIEEKFYDNVKNVSQLGRFIKINKNKDEELNDYLESVEIVFHYILGIGMRYVLRSNAFLGFIIDIPKESLPYSLDKLMLISDE